MTCFIMSCVPCLMSDRMVDSLSGSYFWKEMLKPIMECPSRDLSSLLVSNLDGCDFSIVGYNNWMSTRRKYFDAPKVEECPPQSVEMVPTTPNNNHRQEENRQEEDCGPVEKR